MTYALRRLWYVARRVLHSLYGLLLFFGKPGSRILVPLGTAALMAYQVEPLRYVMFETIRTTGYGPPEPGLVMVALVVLWLLFTGVYYLASRALGVVLGTFPLMARPLPPQRPIRAAKRKEIGRAVVRVVVPSLPRRRTLAMPAPPPPVTSPPPIVPAVVSLAVPPLPQRMDERQAAE
jgi:hypothetical protein